LVLFRYPACPNGYSLTAAQVIRADVPQALRSAVRKKYPKTCGAQRIFAALSANFPTRDEGVQAAICGALPVLATWETSAFCDGPEVRRSIHFLLNRPQSLQARAMDGLGNLATVVLDRCVGYPDIQYLH
jgi:hypothetical protein